MQISGSDFILIFGFNLVVVLVPQSFVEVRMGRGEGLITRMDFCCQTDGAITGKEIGGGRGVSLL